MVVQLPWWRIEILANDIDEIGPELYDLGVQGIHELEPGHAEIFWQGEDPQAIVAAVGTLHGEVRGVNPVAIENWVQQASEQWETIYADRLTVHFLTEFPKAKAPPEAIVAPNALTILPGLGFGTGHHPTTRTVLTMMQHPDLTTWIAQRPRLRTLDLGTGSGILAIAAASLWQAEVDAVEPDPLALENAEQNCAGNGAQGLVRLIEGDIAAVSSRYDLIMANIYAEILCGIVTPLTERLLPEAWVILSGIMAEKSALVKEAYRGLELVSEQELHGWTTLLYRRIL